MPSLVNYVRPELAAMLNIYWIIKDCIDGEPAIKGWLPVTGTNISQNAAAFNGGGDGLMINQAVLAKAKRYLPMPNAADQSNANQIRYNQYLTRAVWYPVTSRTLAGMVGQIFLIKPVTKLPKQLEQMLNDLDGEGLTFEQSSKKACNYVAAQGRAGLFVDYPTTDGKVTQEQIISGQIKPMIKLIAPWNIVSWRKTVINGKEVLTQVVIREETDDYADNEDFAVYTSEQYRVLRLDDKTQNYTVQVYDGEELASGKKSTNRFTPGDVIIPTDSKGNPFKYIPFTFIGSENNESNVNKPPMIDMAMLNIAHYRNSADYEESSHMVGQPTPWASGLSEDWVKNVLKDTISIGSRAGIPLPPNAAIGLLQASPNSMPIEAMKLKEDQMLAIGAKLVMQKRVQRTATEAVFDVTAESSVLTNVANNVSAAYVFAFKAACLFVGSDPSEVSVALNTQFELNALTPDDLSKVVANWQQGAVSFTEMRETLRKAGQTTQTDDEAKKAIQQDRKDGLIPPAGMAGKGGAGGANPNTDPAGHATEPPTRGA